MSKHLAEECRKCEETVFYAPNTAGDTVAIDYYPDSKGQVAIVNGVATTIPEGSTEARERYMLHVNTCGERDVWRNR